MCYVSSAKINNMKEKVVTHLTPELYICALLYMDDIMAAGSKETLERVGKNLRRMEKEKKYTFNNANGKSHYMIVNTGKEQEEKEPNIQVEKGKITQTRVQISRKLDNRNRNSRKTIGRNNKQSKRHGCGNETDRG